MNLAIDFLFVCLFFPLWVDFLILAKMLTTMTNSHKTVTILTMVAPLFTFLFSIFAFLKNITYQSNFSFISINEINFNFGISISQANMLLLGVFTLGFIVLTIFAYLKLKNNTCFYKYFLLLNLINFSAMSFILSTNVLQLFVFSAFVPILFYCVENLTNTSHERAKNFLVINKLGDFVLLLPICVLFYYSVFFDVQLNYGLLNIEILKNLFETVFSILDLSAFTLLCLLLVAGILIKNILIFIYPLKEKCSHLLLVLWCTISFIHWFIVLYPVICSFEYLNLVMLELFIASLIATLLVLCLKVYKHDFAVTLNKNSSNCIKKCYLKCANLVKFFDEKFLDKAYEFISKIMLLSSGIFKTNGEKNTLYALIINIIGILTLIFIVWLILNVFLKG